MMSTTMTYRCGGAAWEMDAERREAGAGDDVATHGTKRDAGGDMPCGKAKRIKVEPEQHVQVKVQSSDGAKNVVRSDAEPETEPAETETSQAPTCGTNEEATAQHSVVHVPESTELDVETFVTSSIIAEGLSSEGEKIMKKLKSAPKTDLQIRMQFAQENGDLGEDRLAISVTTVPPCTDTQKILDEFRDKLSRMEWLDLWENSLHMAMRKKHTAAKTNGYLEVFPGSKRWNSVEKCTLEGGVRIAENKTQMLKIKRIQRVHNPYREVLYRSNCVALKFKPGFKAVNERWLFHGTSTNNPSGVCLGSEGFDPRVCKETNRIGRSIHFCLRANVPAVHYAHKISDKEHQIILARVSCGNLCSVPNYTKRVRPPCIGKETPYSLYDSVLNRVRTYVDAEESNFIGIFDAHQAMPDYLITFEPVPKICLGQKK